jgi:hypothetical protein
MTSTTLAVKTAKVSIPIDVAEFPLHLAPPAGTPGAKNLTFDFVVTFDGVALSLSLKGPQMQKLATAAAGAPQGGFIVLQGKLAANGVVAEPGAAFQPKSER